MSGPPLQILLVKANRALQSPDPTPYSVVSSPSFLLDLLAFNPSFQVLYFPLQLLHLLGVEQTLGQHQQDNAITYLGVRELLRDDRSREEEELVLIPTHL